MQSYVTVATNDETCIGCLILCHSLRKSKTKKKVSVLLYPEVSINLREVLKKWFDYVFCTNMLFVNDENLSTPDEFTDGDKLKCWLLTKFSKCIFLESDAFVVKNIDGLFEKSELSATHNLTDNTLIDAGVFVYEPSVQTYGSLVLISKVFGYESLQILLNVFTPEKYTYISYNYNYQYDASALSNIGNDIKVVRMGNSVSLLMQQKTLQISPYCNWNKICLKWWKIYKAIVEPALALDKQLVNDMRLYEFQRDGVEWLLALWVRKSGAVLADDMGLGKTAQSILFLKRLFDLKCIKSALIVVPTSVMKYWSIEINKWAQTIKQHFYSGKYKESQLRIVQARGGVLLATYETVLKNVQRLNKHDDSEYKWSVLVLDDGHRIKNPSSRTFNAINELRTRHRIVLTGTAVQNNLKELWTLLNFTHQGSLLGLYKEFRQKYEKPITASRQKDASPIVKYDGENMALSLKKIIKPFFLRRTKEEVIKRTDMQSSVPILPRKNDLIIWLPMTFYQINIYKEFLKQKTTGIEIMKTKMRSPLLELNWLKKICDHPRLLSPDICASLNIPVNSINDLAIDDLIAESGKMAFLIQLVRKLVAEDRKSLIFSQSKKILEIIERFLKFHRITLLRLDGDVRTPKKRQEIVDNFNEKSIMVLLLTPKVGGVGLTLTGAERVIIYDSNWNPAVDAQSVDRAYRIGQNKDVVVYRLITCGTVEEKIYRRQIFKDSLNRVTTGVKKTDDNAFRYFTQNELFELFTLSNPHESKTQKHLTKMHSSQRNYNEYLVGHTRWLETQKIIGISDHDLVYSQEHKKIEVDHQTSSLVAAKRHKAEKAVASETEMKEMRHLMNNLVMDDNEAE